MLEKQESSDDCMLPCIFSVYFCLAYDQTYENSKEIHTVDVGCLSHIRFVRLLSETYRKKFIIIAYTSGKRRRSWFINIVEFLIHKKKKKKIIKEMRLIFIWKAPFNEQTKIFLLCIWLWKKLNSNKKIS